MKKISYLIFLLGAVWLIQSCGGTTTNSTTKADSANNAKVSDSTQLKDTTQSTAITVNSDDAKFAVDAANSGMAEVALAKMALRKTKNLKIKAFAKMMVTDHGKANDELMALAKSKNITLPATVSNDVQKDMNNLVKKSGAKFDKAYADMMVDGHHKAGDLFDQEIKIAKDPDLKAFAQQYRATIRMHHTVIQGIQNTLK